MEHSSSILSNAIAGAASGIVSRGASGSRPDTLSGSLSGANWFTTKAWIHQVEAVDLEIVQLAVLCKVKLLSPGVMEQVLDNQPAIAGNDNPKAFVKLRGLLFLHFEIEQRLRGCCASPAQAKALVRLVQDSLVRRLGDKVNALR